MATFDVVTMATFDVVTMATFDVVTMATFDVVTVTVYAEFMNLCKCMDEVLAMGEIMQTGRSSPWQLLM